MTAAPRSLRLARSLVSPFALGALGLLFACGDDGNGGTGFAGSAGTGGKGSLFGKGGGGGTDDAGGDAGEGGATSKGGTSGKGGAGGTSGKGGAGGSSGKGGAGGSSSKGGAGGTVSKGGAGGTSNEGGSGGDAGSGAGGKSSQAPAPLWSFTPKAAPYVDPLSLVTSDDRVYVASYADPVRVVALDGSGEEVFSVDLGEAAGIPANSGRTEAALAVAYDDTLVVALRAFGTVVRLDAQGKVRWTASAELFGNGKGSVSAPAIGKDGSIYVTQSFGEASNAPLPRLLSISASGVVKAFEISAKEERGAAAIPPFASPPHLLPDGRIQVIVGDIVRTYAPGTLALGAEHVLANAKPFSRNGLAVPRPDGGYVTTTWNTTSYIPGCDGQTFATFGQAFDPTGAVTWTTPLPAKETLSGPTSDKGGAWLFSWGNCYDGEGAGTYRVGATGNLLRTFDLVDGSDALQSLGTSGAEILTLQETMTVEGDEASPLVTASNRETGAVIRRFALHCAKGEDAANEEGAFRLLPSGLLIVTCAPSDSAPGQGGVYAFDTQLGIPADSTWPFANGDLRARRSFEGAAGSGAGGSGQAGSGGAGQAGSGQAGSGGSGQAGSGQAGSGGSDVPTSCSQTNQASGCCSADGKTLYYCNAGKVTSQGCADASCGWNDGEGYYDCDTEGLEAPDGVPPIACGL